MQQLLASPRIALSFPRRRFDQFFDRPYVLTRPLAIALRATRNATIPTTRFGVFRM